MCCRKPGMTDSDYSTSAHAHSRLRGRQVQGDSAVGDDDSVAAGPNSDSVVGSACSHRDNAADGGASRPGLHDSRNIEQSRSEPVHPG